MELVPIINLNSPAITSNRLREPGIFNIESLAHILINQME